MHTCLLRATQLRLRCHSFSLQATLLRPAQEVPLHLHVSWYWTCKHPFGIGCVSLNVFSAHVKSPFASNRHDLCVVLYVCERIKAYRRANGMLPFNFFRKCKSCVRQNVCFHRFSEVSKSRSPPG